MLLPFPPHYYSVSLNFQQELFTDLIQCESYQIPQTRIHIQSSYANKTSLPWHNTHSFTCCESNAIRHGFSPRAVLHSLIAEWIQILICLLAHLFFIFIQCWALTSSTLCIPGKYTSVSYIPATDIIFKAHFQSEMHSFKSLCVCA